MCQVYGNTLSPPIYIALPVCTFFAGLGSILVVISLSTHAWELVTWNSDRLKQHGTVNEELSYFDDDNGFYIVVTQETDNQGVVTNTTSYLRNLNGGVWNMCDTLSDNFRKSDRYKAAEDEAGFLKYQCFRYVTQYSERKSDGYLDKKAVSLVRMQNSAASCGIVCVMCLGTAALIGFLGVWRRQVSIVTVTGVMYIVSAVFLCFTLAIMMTKVGYYQNVSQCHSIDQIEDKALCRYRHATTSWSIPIAWAAFTFLLISFCFWLLLSRSVRLEKIKAAML